MQAERRFDKIRSTGRAVVAALILSGLACSLSACSILQSVGLLAADADTPIPLTDIPYQLLLQISASNDLNPDPRTRPSPVQLRVFLSDGQSGIADMRFDQLFSPSSSVSEPRPVVRLMLQPGEQRQLSVPSNHSLTRVIVAAAFRDLNQSRWKVAAEVRPADIVPVTVQVAARSVSIVKQP